MTCCHHLHEYIFLLTLFKTLYASRTIIYPKREHLPNALTFTHGLQNVCVVNVIRFSSPFDVCIQPHTQTNILLPVNTREQRFSIYKLHSHAKLKSTYSTKYRRFDETSIKGFFSLVFQKKDFIHLMRTTWSDEFM